MSDFHSGKHGEYKLDVDASVSDEWTLPKADANVIADHSWVNNKWAVIFTAKYGESVGIKTRTDGVDHPARWESFPETITNPLEMMSVIFDACTQRETPSRPKSG